MAVSKITLPNNTTQDVHDARIAGIDSAPTASSDNLVTSGGVYTAIQNIPGSGSSVSWGTESNYTVPLTVNGVSKTVCLNGYSSGGGGGGSQTVELDLSDLTTNTYILIANGNEAHYNGWSCTDFIDVSSAVVIKANKAFSYSAAYDSTKTFIPGLSITTSYNPFPEGTAYVRISGSDADMAAATVTVIQSGGGGGGGIEDVLLDGTSIVSNDIAVLPAYPTVPTISTNITSDATSDTKTASPKAVKTYVDGIVGDIETLLAAI